jgi:phosphoribosylaminoimidazole-succinocarboxamide synthase
VSAATPAAFSLRYRIAAREATGRSAACGRGGKSLYAVGHGRAATQRPFIVWRRAWPGAGWSTKAKPRVLYEGPEPGTYIQYFKDDATAFNAEKHAVIDGKGVLNNRISEHIMTALNGIGVPTHFIRRVNMREQLIRACEIIPVEIVVRNVAAGSISASASASRRASRCRARSSSSTSRTTSSATRWVTEEHILAFNWASQQDIDDMISLALRVNDFLSGLMLGVGLKLVDFKIECGRIWDGDFQRVIVADEISPDSCRLWDTRTGKKYDKDVFRRDLGSLTEAYAEVAQRLGIMPEAPGLSASAARRPSP